MVYITNWEEFVEAAEKLYAQNPAKTRYTMKYRHNDGNLVLKVTDDIVCLKHKTDQSADIKKLEKLNNLLLRLMTSKKPDHETIESTS